MMYFIPFNNRLYAWSAQYEVRTLYVFSCLVITTLLAFGYGIHRLMLWQTRTLKGSIGAIDQRLLEQKKMVQVTDGFFLSINGMKKTIEQYEKSSSDIQSQLSFILHLLDKAGLRVISYSAEQRLEKAWYHKRMPNFQVEGSLEQLIYFFNTLKQSDKMIECDQVSITQDNQIARATFVLSFYCSKKA